MASGARRQINAQKINQLLPEKGLRTVARALIDASDQQFPDARQRRAAIESKRRQVQKWRTIGPRPVGITARNAELLAAALDVSPEAFLLPLPSPEELRIRRAEQLEAHARELRAGHGPEAAATQS